MNRLVLDRIKQQMAPSNTEAQVKPQPVVEEQREIYALAPEELKKLFMNEVEAATAPAIQTNDRVFDGIEDFVTWYVGVKDKFTDGQNVALLSLIQTRDMINIGCGCKRAQRKQQANQYFQLFWTRNLETDLPAHVMFVGEFSSISFAVESNVFAKYPAATPEKV